MNRPKALTPEAPTIAGETFEDEVFATHDEIAALASEFARQGGRRSAGADDWARAELQLVLEWCSGALRTA